MAALTGIKQGFGIRVIEIVPHMKIIPFINYRQAITTKNLELELHKVLKDAINVVNSMKTRHYNTL